MGDCPGNNYITSQEWAIPTKHHFMPSLIPINRSDFAAKIAREYKCLTSNLEIDCCQKTCGIPNNDAIIRDFIVASSNYPIAVPPKPIVFPSCFPYRTD